MIPNIFSLLGESIVGKHIAKGIIFSNSPKKFHPNGSRIQVLFISLEKRKYIDKIDDNIYKWIRYAEEKSVCNLPKLYQELTTDIKKLAILCK